MILPYLRAVLVCGFFGLSAPAFAFTIEWACNPEPDMKEYRVEYSADEGKSWGVVGTVPHPGSCPSNVTMEDGRYVSPGKKHIRVFALDDEGNQSMPSQVASYVVPPQPVGNTGGRVETPLPPSPYVPVVDLPPTPSVTVRSALAFGLETCLTRKLAHTACMKALAEALGKVTP